jgi:hypothetical protein
MRIAERLPTDKLWRERIGCDLGYVSRRIEEIRYDTNQIIKRYDGILYLLNDSIQTYDMKHAVLPGLRR